MRQTKISQGIALPAIPGAEFALSDCLTAAIGAGYIAGEEISEDDGEFDPLDKVINE